MNKYEVTLWGNDGFHMNLWVEANSTWEAVKMVEDAASKRTIEATERVMVRRIFE